MTHPHFQHPVAYGAPNLVANPGGSILGAAVAAALGAAGGAAIGALTGAGAGKGAKYGAVAGAALSLASNAFAQAPARSRRVATGVTMSQLYADRAAGVPTTVTNPDVLRAILAARAGWRHSVV